MRFRMFRVRRDQGSAEERFFDILYNNTNLSQNG